MSKNIVPATAWKNPYHFIAFGFGSGAMPFAPGTCGTLAAIPFYLLLSRLSLWNYVLTTVIFIGIAIYVCGRTCKEVGEKDCPSVVLDEFAGFFITMIAAPKSWIWIIIGFILFRIFDIWKPTPISWIDANLSGGWGVVLDDVIAGIYALIIMQIIAFPFR